MKKLNHHILFLLLLGLNWRYIRTNADEEVPLGLISQALLPSEDDYESVESTEAANIVMNKLAVLEHTEIASKSPTESPPTIGKHLLNSTKSSTSVNEGSSSFINVPKSDILTPIDVDLNLPAINLDVEIRNVLENELHKVKPLIDDNQQAEMILQITPPLGSNTIFEQFLVRTVTLILDELLSDNIRSIVQAESLNNEDGTLKSITILIILQPKSQPKIENITIDLSIPGANIMKLIKEVVLKIINIASNNQNSRQFILQIKPPSGTTPELAKSIIETIKSILIVSVPNKKIAITYNVTQGSQDSISNIKVYINLQPLGNPQNVNALEFNIDASNPKTDLAQQIIEILPNIENAIKETQGENKPVSFTLVIKPPEDATDEFTQNSLNTVLATLSEILPEDKIGVRAKTTKDSQGRITEVSVITVIGPEEHQSNSQRIISIDLSNPEVNLVDVVNEVLPQIKKQLGEHPDGNPVSVTFEIKPPKRATNQFIKTIRNIIISVLSKHLQDNKISVATKVTRSYNNDISNIIIHITVESNTTDVLPSNSKEINIDLSQNGTNLVEEITNLLPLIQKTLNENQLDEKSSSFILNIKPPKGSTDMFNSNTVNTIIDILSKLSTSDEFVIKSKIIKDSEGIIKSIILFITVKPNEISKQKTEKEIKINLSDPRENSFQLIENILPIFENIMKNQSRNQPVSIPVIIKPPENANDQFVKNITDTILYDLAKIFPFNKIGVHTKTTKNSLGNIININLSITIQPSEQPIVSEKTREEPVIKWKIKNSENIRKEVIDILPSLINKIRENQNAENPVNIAIDIEPPVGATTELIKKITDTIVTTLTNIFPKEKVTVKSKTMRNAKGNIINMTLFLTLEPGVDVPNEDIESPFIQAIVTSNMQPNNQELVKAHKNTSGVDLIKDITDILPKILPDIEKGQITGKSVSFSIDLQPPDGANDEFVKNTTEKVMQFLSEILPNNKVGISAQALKNIKGEINGVSLIVTILPNLMLTTTNRPNNKVFYLDLNNAGVSWVDKISNNLPTLIHIIKEGANDKPVSFDLNIQPPKGVKNQFIETTERTVFSTLSQIFPNSKIGIRIKSTKDSLGNIEEVKFLVTIEPTSNEESEIPLVALPFIQTIVKETPNTQNNMKEPIIPEEGTEPNVSEGRIYSTTPSSIESVGKRINKTKKVENSSKLTTKTGEVVEIFSSTTPSLKELLRQLNEITLGSTISVKTVLEETTPTTTPTTTAIMKEITTRPSISPEEAQLELTSGSTPSIHNILSEPTTSSVMNILKDMESKITPSTEKIINKSSREISNEVTTAISNESLKELLAEITASPKTILERQTSRSTPSTEEITNKITTVSAKSDLEERIAETTTSVSNILKELSSEASLHSEETINEITTPLAEEVLEDVLTGTKSSTEEISNELTTAKPTVILNKLLTAKTSSTQKILEELISKTTASPEELNESVTLSSRSNFEEQPPETTAPIEFILKKLTSEKNLPQEQFELGTTPSSTEIIDKVKTASPKETSDHLASESTLITNKNLVEATSKIIPSIKEIINELATPPTQDNVEEFTPKASAKTNVEATSGTTLSTFESVEEVTPSRKNEKVSIRTIPRSKETVEEFTQAPISPTRIISEEITSTTGSTMEPVIRVTPVEITQKMIFRTTPRESSEKFTQATTTSAKSVSEEFIPTTLSTVESVEEMTLENRNEKMTLGTTPSINTINKLIETLTKKTSEEMVATTSSPMRLVEEVTPENTRPNGSMEEFTSELKTSTETSIEEMTMTSSPMLKTVTSRTTGVQTTSSHEKPSQEEININLSRPGATFTSQVSEILPHMVPKVENNLSKNRTMILNFNIRPPKGSTTSFLQTTSQSLVPILTKFFPDNKISVKANAKKNSEGFLSDVVLMVRIEPSQNTIQVQPKEKKIDIDLSKTGVTLSSEVDKVLPNMVPNVEREMEQGKPVLLSFNIRPPKGVTQDFLQSTSQSLVPILRKYFPNNPMSVKVNAKKNSQGYLSDVVLLITVEPSTEIRTTLKPETKRENIDIDLTKPGVSLLDQVDKRLPDVMPKVNEELKKGKPITLNFNIRPPNRSTEKFLQTTSQSLVPILTKYFPTNKITVKANTEKNSQGYLSDIVLIITVEPSNESEVTTTSRPNEKNINIDLSRPGDTLIEQIDKTLPKVIDTVMEDLRKKKPTTLDFNIRPPPKSTKEFLQTTSQALVPILTKYFPDNQISVKANAKQNSQGYLSDVILSITIEPGNEITTTTARSYKQENIDIDLSTQGSTLVGQLDNVLPNAVTNVTKDLNLGKPVTLNFNIRPPNRSTQQFLQTVSQSLVPVLTKYFPNNQISVKANAQKNSRGYLSDIVLSITIEPSKEQKDKNIDIDLSKQGSTLSKEVNEILPSVVTNIENDLKKGKPITLNFNIKPPQRSTQSFLQTSTQALIPILSKYFPTKEISVKANAKKNSQGYLTDIILMITIQPSEKSEFPTDEQPEEKNVDIDLTKPGISLVQEVNKIMPTVLRQVEHNLNNGQPMTLNFNIRPPNQSTQQFLQKASQSLVPILSKYFPNNQISVKANAQKNNQGYLSDVVLSITIQPKNEPETTAPIKTKTEKNVDIDLTKPGISLIKEVDKIMPTVVSEVENNLNDGQPMTLNFNIRPPGRSTQQFLQKASQSLVPILSKYFPNNQISVKANAQKNNQGYLSDVVLSINIQPENKPKTTVPPESKTEKNVDIDLSEPGSNLRDEVNKILPNIVSNIRNHLKNNQPITLNFNIRPPNRSTQSFLQSSTNSLVPLLSKYFPTNQMNVKANAKKNSQGYLSDVTLTITIEPSSSPQPVPTSGIEVNLDLSRRGSSLTNQVNRALPSIIDNVEKVMQNEQPAVLEFKIKPPMGATENFLKSTTNNLISILSKTFYQNQMQVKSNANKDGRGKITDMKIIVTIEP